MRLDAKLAALLCRYSKCLYMPMKTCFHSAVNQYILPVSAQVTFSLLRSTDQLSLSCSHLGAAISFSTATRALYPGTLNSSSAAV